MRMFFLLTLIIGVMTAAAQGGSPNDTTLSPSERVLKAMEEIRIPEVDFRQADIRDVVTFLFNAANEFDPKKRGISIILKLRDTSPDYSYDATGFFQAPAATNIQDRTPQTLITFSALDITLKEALQYSVDIAGLRYVVRGGAIMILDHGTILDSEIIRRVYDIDPLRFAKLFPADELDAGDVELQRLSQLKKRFVEWGGNWPGKSALRYHQGVSQLFVANTQAEIDIFERFLALFKLQPYQLEIEVHFVAYDKQDIAALGINGITIEALTELRNEGKGELLAAPRVLTQSGMSATIKGVTECIYPTEYHIVTTGTNTNSTASISVVEPSDYCTREIGPILDVTAEAQPDSNVISLTICPELVEPPVWHQFGSAYTDAQGNALQTDMPQPHFHSYKEVSNVRVSNGKTVLIGGGVPSRDGKELVYMFLNARMVGMDGKRLWEAVPEEDYSR